MGPVIIHIHIHTKYCIISSEFINCTNFNTCKFSYIFYIFLLFPFFWYVFVLFFLYSYHISIWVSFQYFFDVDCVRQNVLWIFINIFIWSFLFFLLIPSNFFYFVLLSFTNLKIREDNKWKIIIYFMIYQEIWINIYMLI